MRNKEWEECTLNTIIEAKKNNINNLRLPKLLQIPLLLVNTDAASKLYTKSRWDGTLCFPHFWASISSPLLPTDSFLLRFVVLLRFLPKNQFILQNFVFIIFWLWIVWRHILMYIKTLFLNRIAYILRRLICVYVSRYWMLDFNVWCRFTAQNSLFQSSFSQHYISSYVWVGICLCRLFFCLSMRIILATKNTSEIIIIQCRWVVEMHVDGIRSIHSYTPYE